jgi:hypothetical protein
MGAEQTTQTRKSKKHQFTSKEDQIFEQAIKRLKSTSDVGKEDKKCILKLVEHLLSF